MRTNIRHADHRELTVAGLMLLALENYEIADDLRADGNDYGARTYEADARCWIAGLGHTAYTYPGGC